MTTIYVDSVFLLNGTMDYLLFLLTARLAGIPLRRRRYLLAALAGGFYAVAVFFPGCGFLAKVPIKVALGVLLALIAFGCETRLLKLIILLFLLSCAMAGCVLALGLISGSRIPIMDGIFYTDVDAKVLLIAAAAAYFLLTVVFRAAAKHNVNGELLSVRVCMDGCVVSLTALWDSGNGLRDPVGGLPVLVVFFQAVSMALSSEVRQLLTKKRLLTPTDLLPELRNAAPQLRPRLLPYQAVGVSSGLLLVLHTDWTEIAGIRYMGLPLALSATELGNEYVALWGGELGKEGQKND